MTLRQTKAPAEFRWEKMRVATLLQQRPLPTLGEIDWAVSTDMKWAPRRMLKDDYLRWHEEEYYPFLWSLLDQKFGERADYRLWRVIVMRSFPSQIGKTWPGILDTALAALECPEDLIVWGALSVLAGYLTSKELSGEVLLNEKSRLEIASHSERRFHEGLAPIRGGETGCALIRALAWSAIQQTYQKELVMSPDQVREFLDRFERSLQDADSNWQPGDMLYIGHRLKDEAVTGRAVAPYDDVELQMRVAQALFKMRGAARCAIQALDEAGEHLVRRAMLLAFSSWRFTRSIRVGEQKHQEKHPHYRPHYNVAGLRRQEMVALKRFADALRDAGYYLDAGFAAWLVLTLLPNELLTDSEFHHIGTQLAGVVRSVGLAVPQRFARPRDESRRRAKHHRPISQSPLEQRVATTSVPPETDVTPERRKRERVEPHFLRVRREYKTDERWREIGRAEPDAPNNPWYALGRVVDRRAELAEDLSLLRAAFGLCLRYVRLREAAQVAQYLDLNKIELVALAHTIKRALQLELLAVDHHVHEEWRTVLRKNWTRLSDRTALSGDETLVVHEVLRGRYPSIVRGRGSDVSRTLVLKLYGQVDEAMVAELLDLRSGRHAFRRGLATVTIGNLQKALQRSQFGAMGAPVCLSVARLSDDRVSLIAVGSGGVRMEELTISGIHAAPEQIRSTYMHWLLSQGQTRRLTIPTHSSIKKLARAISDLVHKVDASCRWLVLAVEPDLASLAWNSLVTDGETHSLVVSLVPSLSWFERAIDERSGQTIGCNSTVRLSPDKDLVGVTAQIKNDERKLGDLVGSCGVIVGHGQTSASGIPNVVLGNRALTLPEWLNLATHRVLMVHSCHSGRVSHTLPSDLGGLPGIALSIGCHLMFAPVTEVPPDAALALHAEMARRDGPAELGLRYLAAVERNAAVALYNLYGFADEEVRSTSMSRIAVAKAAS